MGDPVSLGVMAVVGVGSAVADYQGQKADAQMQKQSQEAHNKAVREATIENYKELDLKEQDIVYNQSQDTMENQIEFLERASAQEAMSSATGIRGGTADLMTRELVRTKHQGDADIADYRDQALKGIDAHARELSRNARASYRNEPIRKPNVWKSVSTGINNGMTAYNMASSVQSSSANFKSAKSGGGK